MTRRIHAAFCLMAAFLTLTVMSQTRAAAQDPPPAAPVVAQTPQTTPAPAQATADYHAAPTVRLFGVPTALWAPVDPPYTGAAYRTLGGQAETSADAVAEQGTPWH